MQVSTTVLSRVCPPCLSRHFETCFTGVVFVQPYSQQNIVLRIVDMPPAEEDELDIHP